MLTLVSVAGCELPPKQPPPRAREPDIAPVEVAHDPTQQILDVTVREYGSNEPLYGVTVELAQDPPCMHGPTPHCAPPPGRFTTTDDLGVAHFELPFGEEWRVARVAEPGYLTECPGLQDDTWHHRLVIKHHAADRDDYTCMLVPKSALKVRDRAAAIRLARADADAAVWLRYQRDARLSSVELHGIRWEVWFATPGAGTRDGQMDPRTGEVFGVNARGVVVDALDASTHLDYVITPYSDYLPSDYLDPAR